MKDLLKCRIILPKSLNSFFFQTEQRKKINEHQNSNLRLCSSPLMSSNKFFCLSLEPDVKYLAKIGLLQMDLGV